MAILSLRVCCPCQDCVAEARNKLLNTAAAAVHQQKQWQELADEIVEENRALQAKRVRSTCQCPLRCHARYLMSDFLMLSARRQP